MRTQLLGSYHPVLRRIVTAGAGGAGGGEGGKRR